MPLAVEDFAAFRGDIHRALGLIFGAGLQVALPAGLVTQVRWNAGTVREDDVIDPAAWRQGIGATLAVRTSFGVFAGHVAGEPGGTYRAEADMGFAF